MVLHFEVLIILKTRLERGETQQAGRIKKLVLSSRDGNAW